MVTGACVEVLDFWCVARSGRNRLGETRKFRKEPLLASHPAIARHWLEWSGCINKRCVQFNSATRDIWGKSGVKRVTPNNRAAA
jgi:hypothetical protein